MRALLDTNVLSESTKLAPNGHVLHFLSSGVPAFISALTLHELRHGAELIKDIKKREKLSEWVNAIRRDYATHILPITPDIAETAAILRASASRKGRILHIEDALIAATALEHQLTLITRNTSDFEITEIPQLNPWQD